MLIGFVPKCAPRSYQIRSTGMLMPLAGLSQFMHARVVQLVHQQVLE